MEKWMTVVKYWTAEKELKILIQSGNLLFTFSIYILHLALLNINSLV